MLNQLIAGCMDIARVYRHASVVASDPETRKQLKALSRRRSGFVSVLEERVAALHGVSRRAGSISGTFRLVMRAIMARVDGNHDGNSFLECARVEKSVSDRYARALRNTWSDDTASLLRLQFEEMVTAHDQMRVLRGAC